MFNLIWKDILIQKKTLAYMGLYIILFGITFQNITADPFPAIAVAVTYQMIAAACSHEDKSGADILWNSMPVSREKLVLSKYLSMFVYTLLASLGYMAFAAVIHLTRLPIKASPITATGMMGSIVAIALMNSLYLPVYFRLGFMKARVASFFLFFALFFGVTFGVNVLSEEIHSAQGNTALRAIASALQSASDLQISLLLLGLAFVFLLASFCLSVKFYRNREF
ncbi:ABC-2 transporter permease [Eubacteriales bacterium mix99]